VSLDTTVDALCVGAHPDDVEIGMGATIAKMVSEGMRVAIVDLTDGEPTPFGSAELRAAEAREAAQVLGVTRRTLGGENRYLFDTREARVELAEVIRELRPRILFVPYDEDAHPDHVAAAQIAVGARFYAKFTRTDMSGEPWYPARVYRYMAVHMRFVTVPSFVVDVSDHLEAKLAAVGAYRSQFVDNPANSEMIDSLRDQARAWGESARVRYGEAFFAPETVCIRSIGDLV
jgi:N-acetylglucosamine malate deacetylase 1